MITKKTKLSNEHPRFCQICKRWFPTGKSMGGHMRSHLAISKLPSGDRLHRPAPPPPPPPPPPTPKRKRRHQSPAAEINKREIARSDEEEVAVCLLMLSRDPRLLDFVWKKKKAPQRNGKAPIADYYGHQNDDVESRGEKKYRCETCNKGFGSYQALGGHRASHNKSSSSSSAKSLAADVDDDEDDEEDYLEEEEEDHNQEQEVVVATNTSHHEVVVSNAAAGRVIMSRKQFPCSFCGKVFESGQALGGHKKIHMSSSYHHHQDDVPMMMSTPPTKASSKPVRPLVVPPGGRLMIHLNSSPLDRDGWNDDDESDEVYRF